MLVTLALVLLGLLLPSRPALAVYSCGGHNDSCNCNAQNPYPCCSNGGNCTWWAWHSMCCNWSIGPGNWGNAKEWAGHAKADSRFELRSTPVAGSVGVRVSTSYGHVAWVKSVQGSMVEVTEMGCWSWYGMRTKLRPASDFDGGFIVLRSQYKGGSLGASGQSYPVVSAGAVKLTVGQSVSGWVKLKNAGTKTWEPGKVWLAPIPRDQASPLSGPTWKSATRISTVDATVAPGQVGTFALDITGNEPGTTTLKLGWVADGVTWFADSPQGGGPDDGYFAVQVEVVQPDPPDAGPPDTGPVLDGGVELPRWDPDGSADFVVFHQREQPTPLGGGCSAAGRPSLPAPALLLALFWLLDLRRRRPL